MFAIRPRLRPYNGLLSPPATFMNEFDEIAHVVQLSIAPVFLLTGVGTLLNVLSGRLARIVDRARVLEERLGLPDQPHADAMVNELQILERRGQLIYRAITLSTISALMVCLVVASLFASWMLRYPTRFLVAGLFILAMLSSIISLVLFLREVFFAIETFEIALPAKKWRRLSDPDRSAPDEPQVELKARS